MNTTERHVCTHASEDYAYKLCHCFRCGTERAATFNFDYYPGPEDPKGGNFLVCEHCLMREHFGTATPPTDVIHPDGRIERLNQGDKPNLN